MGQFDEFGVREKAGWADTGIVSAYVQHFVPITDLAGARLMEQAVSPGDAVLDLCCGQGTLTAAMIASGARVTGLDFSPEMLARARKAAPGAELVEGDATRMPFADDSFDKVVCNFGMMHIADQPAALREIARVLKPGGTFAMATWASPPNSPAFGIVFGTLRELGDFSSAPPQPDLFAFADPETARAMMNEAGLEMTDHGTVAAAWETDTPEGLFDIFMTATVGAKMLLAAQTPETLDRIGARIAHTVAEKFRDGDGFRVPVNVSVISARAV